jgi:hypothetical protein
LEKQTKKNRRTIEFRGWRAALTERFYFMDDDTNSFYERRAADGSECCGKTVEKLREVIHETWQRGAEEARSAAQQAAPRAREVIEDILKDLSYTLSFGAAFASALARDLASEEVKESRNRGTEAGAKAAQDLLAKVHPPRTGPSPSAGSGTGDEPF